MENALLKVQDLAVGFKDFRVLNGISFDVKKGDIMAILGPNGAGKTVLFRALLGLIPYEGNITWDKNVKVGYVPQKLAIEKDLPLTVREFLGFKANSEEAIYEALQEVGFIKKDASQHHIEHHVLNAKLGQLSGGEFQRVLIAYALIDHPDVLLFDEPTAGVDIGGEETIYSLLEKLHKKWNLTILLITHDLNVIYRYAHRVLCLNREKVCYGSPKEILNPSVLQELYGANVGFYQHEHNKG